MNDIMNLKHNIKEQNVSDSFKIFIYEDNTFAVNQYIETIAEIKNVDIRYITSLSDLNTDDIFDDLSQDVLYVLNVDKLLPPYVDPLKLNNVIVKCKSIDASITNQYADYVYKFPKLQQWQIHDLVKTLTNLDEKKVNWLCEVSNWDVYRLYYEALKLKLFQDTNSAFELFNIEDAYSDLSNYNIFNFITAITKRDLNTIVDILKNINNIDIEPYGVLTLLLRQFRTIIDIQMNPKASAESLNMPPKQFYAIKMNCGRFDNNKLIDIYEKLTSIDLMLKSGELDNNKIIEYLLINILN